MRIYLDNCSFNRPFDDQSQIRVRMEAEAKLFIQDQVQGGHMELAWSYILDYENSANPFSERRTAIAGWKRHAVHDVHESEIVMKMAEEIHQARGLSSMDALHVACAIEACCDYYITTDDGLIRKMSGADRLNVLDPTAFIREVKR